MRIQNQAQKQSFETTSDVGVPKITPRVKELLSVQQEIQQKVCKKRCSFIDPTVLYNIYCPSQFMIH